MKKQILTTAITAVLTILCHSLKAQDKATVRGTINDHKGIALHAATIYLLQAADSSLVKAGIADEKGNYELVSLSPGNYLLSITAIGFETIFLERFELKAGQSHQVKPIQLSPKAKQLEGFTVTASK